MPAPAPPGTRLWTIWWRIPMPPSKRALRLHGSAWKLLRTNVDLSPSSASLQNGELDPADRGRISFNLRAGLQQWSFTQSSPIQLALNATQVNVADLSKLAGSSAPISGTL